MIFIKVGLSIIGVVLLWPISIALGQIVSDYLWKLYGGLR